MQLDSRLSVVQSLESLQRAAALELPSKLLYTPQQCLFIVTSLGQLVMK